MNEIFFIKEALKLAKKGMSWTNPNPMVGTVIVKDDKIIGKGYHREVGLLHAEIEALNDAKTSIRGVTLYVNLEPCSHYGRTPPCVDAIVKSGITRVVCSSLDPNPKVHGKGIELLRKAGIKVSVGILEKEARNLNEAFFTFHEKKRPFIAIKFAASLDGKIATRTGDSRWITNERARNFARQLRAEYQAILVGVNTVITDNPHLGVRNKSMKDPIRIILDPHLKISLTSQVFRDANVFIATTSMCDKEKLIKLRERNIPYLLYENDTIPLPCFLQDLREREIISIFVEGGGKTIGSFIDERLVDKVYAFHAPILLGGEKAVSAISGKGVKTIQEAMMLERIYIKRFGDNTLTIGYPKRG